MTWYFDFIILLFEILIKKHPSPSTNPANPLGSLVFEVITFGLLIAIVFGKAAFKTSDKPKFIEALRVTIFSNPSSVKCSLFFINSQICLKSI